MKDKCCRGNTKQTRSTSGTVAARQHETGATGATGALTVGAIAEFGIEEDAGFVLSLLGQVNSQVQILNPLPHFHLRAADRRQACSEGRRSSSTSQWICSFRVSPGSHDNGSLSRVDGEAVGDRPLVFAFLHLQTEGKVRHLQPRGGKPLRPQCGDLNNGL